MSSASRMPTIGDVETFMKRSLSRNALVDVFAIHWGNAWRIAIHTRRPGALPVGRFNAFVSSSDLLEAVIETIRQAPEEHRAD